MAIERQQMDILVITVVLSNGLTFDHRYAIGNVRNRDEFELLVDSALRQPHEALMGLSRAKAFVLNNPWGIYNVSHVMGLRIRGEGSAQAQRLADHVHEMGFLARDRRV